jgi:5-formyltetrahydrofolate cyclo-ligase
LLGLAFSCQRLDEPLLRDAWDVPLDAVLTERGLEHFQRHALVVSS